MDIVCLVTKHEGKLVFSTTAPLIGRMKDGLKLTNNNQIRRVTKLNIQLRYKCAQNDKSLYKSTMILRYT